MASIILLLVAAGANGGLAGASLDQSIKQLPARHRIGIQAYSRYSQAADLANGVVWYATLGVGTAVLTLVASIFTILQPVPPLSVIAAWVAMGATIVHSGATALAAPTNFRQRALHRDDRALVELFDRFERWQTVRVIGQVVALIAVLTACFGTVRP
ncbi:MAG: hypothetical protein ACREQM_00415 [Candidatus Dormibacteraceae bacterium]